MPPVLRASWHVIGSQWETIHTVIYSMPQSYLDRAATVPRCSNGTPRAQMLNTRSPKFGAPLFNDDQSGTSCPRS
ncbi:uncharacterized protein PHALS_00999 [Plasmopara halstedii]|uniref:Uncharacterized protein n=1 Tax=Plasmopara halstedii TaxID=4781 RepID=A0A0P1AS72_PLAHL|nr:uncharacterized protein PHALS_00999 [Plasmopara halstedii]CEG44653.1 hypothetical protein PHALS_00999 [Plasmopara halstedii]|eukprot:XP_024581022.1 hypothetical protein PHALS_00999 [Plasmopara halstedii]